MDPAFTTRYMITFYAMIAIIAILLIVIKCSRKKINPLTLLLSVIALMLAANLTFNSEDWNVTKQEIVALETVYKGGTEVEKDVIGCTRRQISKWEDSLFFSGMEKNSDGSETWHCGMGQGMIIVHYNAFDVVTDIDIVKTD